MVGGLRTIHILKYTQVLWGIARWFRIDELVYSHYGMQRAKHVSVKKLLTKTQARMMATLLLLLVAPVAFALDLAAARGPRLVNNDTQGTITMNGIW